MSIPSPSRHITLTADQMDALHHFQGAVEVRDPEGKPVGYVSATTEPDPSFGWTADEVRQAKLALASNQRRYSSDEALALVRQQLGQ